MEIESQTSKLEIMNENGQIKRVPESNNFEDKAIINNTAKNFFNDSSSKEEKKFVNKYDAYFSTPYLKLIFLS